MAHAKNWKPAASLPEQEWFDKCPKAVLFEIARQLAMRVADDYTAEGAFAEMQKEWAAVYENGLVPQKPFTPRSEAEILAKMPPEIRKLYATT